LQDWVALLNKAKGSIESLDTYNVPLQVTDADADGAPSTTQPGVLMTKKLLLDLYGLSKNKKGLKVLENVQIAALHVACMIKGKTGGNRLVGGVSPEPL
jgi:hypothetical protein